MPTTSAVYKLDAKHKKIAIFSDTHLTHKFDVAQFEFLKGVIKSVNQVIINGDFWDKYETTWEKFINSEWQKLFVLLKKKQAIYLYGNHDLAKFSDERVNFFSKTQADICLVKTGKYELQVQHGHQITGSGDISHPQLVGNKLILGLGSRLQAFGVKLFGQFFLPVIFLRWRWKFKKYCQHLSKDKILVCGHAHTAELDLSKNYINDGVIRWGLGQYLLVEDGELRLFTSRYS